MNKEYWLLIVSLFFACGNSYTPKPTAYSRIDFPEKNTSIFTSNCPFTFQKAIYCDINYNYEDKCWFDLDFNNLNGKIHMSYKKLNNNLNQFTEDSRTLAYKHAQVAEAISEQLFIRDSSSVYGMVYTFQGNTATPMQFYLTDSMNHFVRGALYFDTPLNDSIIPISNFVKDDIYQLIESWQWK